MPRLHKYLNRNAYYVLTAIRGAVVTFQLTAEGERKLTAGGIASGQQFHRALLLDLYRTGDAYTDSSIPVSVLTRPLLSRLFQLKSVTEKGKNVTQFEELLHAEFESKWEALRKSRGPSQKSLFGDGLDLSSG